MKASILQRKLISKTFISLVELPSPHLYMSFLGKKMSNLKSNFSMTCWEKTVSPWAMNYSFFLWRWKEVVEEFLGSKMNPHPQMQLPCLHLASSIYSILEKDVNQVAKNYGYISCTAENSTLGLRGQVRPLLFWSHASCTITYNLLFTSGPVQSWNFSEMPNWLHLRYAAFGTTSPGLLWSEWRYPPHTKPTLPIFLYFWKPWQPQICTSHKFKSHKSCNISHRCWNFWTTWLHIWPHDKLQFFSILSSK